jgi:4-hydroxybenzoate polyprenyltransferase
MQMDTGKVGGVVRMLGPVVWLGVAAGVQMAGALLFFKTSLDPVLISTGALLTFSVYLLNRFTDTEDSYNCPEQKMFFQRTSSLIAIPIVLISLSMLVLIVSNRLALWHIVLIAGGILYSVSVVPFVRNRSLNFVRLKDIVFVKNIVVSLLWGLTAFVLAAAQKTSVMPQRADLVVVIAAFGLTSLINTTSCDVRDVLGDSYTNVSTLATRFGVKTTASFLFLLSLIASVFVVVNYLAGNVGRPTTLLFFANMVWTGLVAAPLYIKRISLPKSFSEPLIDSQFVMNGVSLIVLSSFL